MREMLAEIERREESMSPDTATETASKILRALAAAFGGYSQFRNEIVGLALLGQANNNKVPPHTVARAAAQLLGDRWEWDDEEIYREICRAYNDERARLGWTHVPELK